MPTEPISARGVSLDGDMLRTARLAHEWSQADMAELANVSLSTVKRAENGRPVSMEACLRVTEVLGLLWSTVVVREVSHPVFMEGDE